MDMKYLKAFDRMDTREIMPGFHGKFIHKENFTLALWRIEKDAVLPLHDHYHEQLSMVLQGRLKLIIDGQDHVFGPGEVATIPGGIPHEGYALEESKVLDIFSPVREDYK